MTTGDAEGAMRGSRRTIRADGDRWSARLARTPSSGDVQAVLFFCVTTDQRPYRVVEVPRELLPDDAALETASAEDLRALFAESRSMDFPRNYHGSYPAPS